MNQYQHRSASKLTLLMTTLTVAALAVALSPGFGTSLFAQAQPGGQNAKAGKAGNANPAVPAGQRTQEGDNVRYTLAYPTGDRDSSALLLEKVSPARVKAGQPFTYTIRVTNLTDQPLANVTVVESFQSGLQLESSNPPYAPVRTSPASRRQNQQKAQASAQQGKAGQKKAEKNQAHADHDSASAKSNSPQANRKKSPQAADSAAADSTNADTTDAADAASAKQPAADGNNRQTARQGNQGNQQKSQQEGQMADAQPRQTVRWDVTELMPGKTHTITVRAAAQGRGSLASCMTATYQPTLCTMVEAVAPELTLTKELANGKEQQPKSTQTEADSAYVYLCDTFTYRYTVANTGTAVSKDVSIRDPLAEGLTTVDGDDSVTIPVGDLQPGQKRSFTQEIKAAETGSFTSRAVAKSASDEAASQRVTTNVREADLAVQISGPEWTYSGDPVTFQVSVTNNGDVPARGVKLSLMSPGWPQRPKERDLGNIGAGQTVPVSVTVEPRADREKIELNATATSVCAMGENSAKGVASANIRRVPALLIEMVDDTDPLKMGGQTTYSINVKNQGTAAANGLQLDGELTEQLQFVKGSGATKVSGQGQKVQFGAVETLKPGDVVSWKVQAKAVKAGDGRLRVNMTADNVSQKGLEIEPTTAVEAAPTKIGNQGSGSGDDN